MLATSLINPLMRGIYVGLPKGQFFYVITQDQHMIHRRTRVINVKKENPAQGNYSFPQKLSSVGFSVTFFQFPLNLDCESICDPPGGDALLAQGIYLTDYIYIYIYITNCRQYCFGLLGLISAVLMSRMD